MITVTCPQCNAAMNCDESAAGQTVKCYACQCDIIVPGAEAPAAPQLPACGGNSNVIGFAGVGLGAVALIVALIALLVSAFSSADTPFVPFAFSSDPETTAERILERNILAAQCDDDSKAYFFQKYGDDFLDNLEFEVLEDGKYAAVFYKTKVKDNTFCGMIQLVKNNDDEYVVDKSWKDAPEKFLERVHKKNEKYEKDATPEKDIDYDDLKD